MATHNSMLDILQQSASSTLAKTDLQILRASDDLFRQAAITAGEINFKEGDILTRTSAAQTMMNDFNQKGINAITYKNGTKMPIDSYSEMAGRTMSGNAAVQGSLNRYQEYGFDLFKISSHFMTCQMCAPWENRVVSIDGRNPKYPTLADAIATGYGHPNCIHTVAPWREGFPITETRLDPAQQRLVDRHGYKRAQEIAYKAQQRQRTIERQVKKWKMRQATSLDPKVAAKGKMKVSQWQAQQRHHLKQNPFLRRDYARESIRSKTMFVDIKEQTEKLAKELIARVQPLTDPVKAKLQGIAKFNKVKMEGLEWHVKGQDSLMRKIRQDFIDSAGAKSLKVVAENTGDVLRYTYILDEKKYVQQMNALLADLKKAGFKNYKFKNTWLSPDYKGINTNWYYKGQKLEIQFHTAQSFYYKEKYAHPIYKKLRIELDPIKKALLKKQNREVWAKVTAPDASFMVKVTGYHPGKAPPGKILRVLTPEQSKAVVNFTGHDYREINYILRNPGSSGLGMEDSIKHLKTAMKNNVLAQEVEVYRGMSSKMLDSMRGGPGGDPSKLIGQVYQDKGFVSTTMTKNNPVVENQGNYLVEIKAPTGTRGIKVGNLSHFPDEDEFLLDAGYMYEITGAEFSKTHPGLIIMKVLLRW